MSFRQIEQGTPVVLSTATHLIGNWVGFPDGKFMQVISQAPDATVMLRALCGKQARGLFAHDKIVEGEVVQAGLLTAVFHNGEWAVYPCNLARACRKLPPLEIAACAASVEEGETR